MRESGHHRAGHPWEHRTGHATDPGPLGEAGTSWEPRTFGEPRASREPGAFGEAGTSWEPRTFGEPRASREPRTFGEPRASRGPRTFRVPRTLGAGEIHWRLPTLPTELRDGPVHRWQIWQQLPGNPKIHARLTKRGVDRRRRYPRVHRQRDRHRHRCGGN